MKPAGGGPAFAARQSGGSGRIFHLEKRKKIVYLLLALLVFGAIFGGGFLRSERRALAKGTMTPDLVIMGDSIFASCRSEDSVGHKIAEALQIEVSDVSFGGTGLCYRDPDGRLSYTGDLFCMSALAQAVVTGDFRVQESARIRQNATDYYPERLKELESIDFTGVKVLLIGHQLNDYQGGVPLDDPKNQAHAEAEYNYRGALRRVIESLKEHYPELRIVLVSAPYVWYPEEGTTAEQRDFGHGTLTEYARVQREMAEEYETGWISLWDVYPSKAAEDWYTYTVDGMHPGDLGRELIAQKLTEELRTYFQ